MRRGSKRGSNRGPSRPGRNPRPQNIPKSSSHETHRNEKGRWVIGIHAVAEVFNVRPRSIRRLQLREGYERSQELLEFHQKAKLKQISVEIKAVGFMDKMGTGHQGVACLVDENPQMDWQSLKSKDRVVILALDGLEDPQNLGSIMRTAWLSRVDAILLPADRSVSLTPTVAKIASGGAEHIPIEEVVNLPETLKQAKADGFWIFGLAEEGANRIWDLQLPEKLIWVIGSEASGLRTPTARACDELVNIPQAPTGSSYNASIAASMALYETMRQAQTRSDN